MGVVLLSFGCAHAPTPMGEHLIVSESSGMHAWQLLSYKNYKNNEGYVRYYVPPGKENLKSPSEQIAINFFSGNTISIKQYEEADNNRLKVQCPGTRHQVIESDTYNVYYTNSYPPCGGQKSQSEISRLIQGNEGMYHLSYTVIGRGLTSAEKEKWLKILRDSFIAKGDQHEKVRCAVRGTPCESQ